MNNEMTKRLMAACAQAEIMDVLNGEGDVELAKKSLHLLCSMIAEVYPCNSSDNTTMLQLLCDLSKTIKLYQHIDIAVGSSWEARINECISKKKKYLEDEKSDAKEGHQ